MTGNSDNSYVACSDCFVDQGLCLDADRIGEAEDSQCPRCKSGDGKKLTVTLLGQLAHRFFVWGSTVKSEYGAAPVIQFNEHQKTSIEVSPWLSDDVKVFESILGVGFFRYGPRLWMIGETEPIEALRDPNRRQGIIDRILTEYPSREIDTKTQLYRIRKEPEQPDAHKEYDSPPIGIAPHGRLDHEKTAALYASEDLGVCVHECRITAEDEVFVATLQPTTALKMLDLTFLLKEEGVDEFESLDIAVHMLFLAGTHSYPITQNISASAKDRGFNGIIYPSYFSMLRYGIMPFQTTYGISHRRVPSLQDYEESTTVPNVAIFGRPIQAGMIEIKCINRLVLTQVAYDFRFGPVIS